MEKQNHFARVVFQQHTYQDLQSDIQHLSLFAPRGIEFGTPLWVGLAKDEIYHSDDISPLRVKR